MYEDQFGELVCGYWDLKGQGILKEKRPQFRLTCIFQRRFCLSSLIASLSNYDDDHNDDFKKTIGVMIKTTSLHVHHAF